MKPSDYISASAKKRLPAAIRGLSDKEQAAFILLRMRRDEAHIARELGVNADEAGRVIRTVQDCLVKSGALDMIQNPVFFHIDHPVNNNSHDAAPLELPDKQMDTADRLALENFYKTLEQSLESLPQDGRRLLRLWFNNEMRAKDILNFYKNIGIPLSTGKSIHETTEQDVFYAIEKNIRNLLNIVRSNMKEDEIALTPSSLRAILEETGA